MEDVVVEHHNFGWLHKPPLPPACCHCLAIRQEGRIVLIDSGIGTHDIEDPSRRIGREAIDAAGFKFIESVTAKATLERAGFRVDDVTDIVLTHCDPDHVGGLADFPEANVHVSAEEKANLDSQNLRYSPKQFDHGPRWQIYSTDDSTFFQLPSRKVASAIDAEIHLIPLFGHTFGHCGVAVRETGGWTLHVGDAYYLRGELTQDPHPITELAVARADDDDFRRESLNNIRKLVAHSQVHSFRGYHDVTELPPTVEQFNEVA